MDQQQETVKKGQEPSAQSVTNGADMVGGEELAKLRAKAAERDQYLDMLQRSRAEFENYQKRAQKDREQERRYMYGPLVFDFLPVLDNLDRAVVAAQQAGETGPLVQGVALVQNQFLELLKRYGITRIDALGKPFDPNIHQAVMQQPAKDQPANTVVQVLEQGFMNQDRVLRPAKVVVAI
jgi:molecular chaperone GrpE